MRIVERFAGHTPGPWCVMPEEADKPYIRVRGTRLGERYKIANALGGENELEANEAQANARLIAEAPRHLALLEQAEAALGAGRALVAKLDQVSEDSAGVFQIAAAHGYEYRGAQYGEALETFRALLAKLHEGGE